MVSSVFFLGALEEGQWWVLGLQWVGMPLSGPEYPPSSQSLGATVRGVDVLNLEPTFLL